MVARVADLARAEALELNFDRALTVNTLSAHRALHLATERSVASAAEERLMHAHFTEGADLSDPEVSAGLLGEDAEEAQALGANGVPFFVIDRKYGISGAQPAEAFLHALRTAYAD
jgi:predicted DsbA family dithiol-disulfide isomerase